MKIIISHDIDHLTVWEHKSDLIIPKVIIRGLIEYCLGYISIKEVTGRLKDIINNKWQNLDQLMEFNKSNSIPSTFFIGVANGNGLNYSLDNATKWALKILKEGHDLGIHGLSHSNMSDVKSERKTFEQIAGLKNFGIRMHYLNCNEATIDLLNNANYSFDCSVVGMANPYKVNGLWEFPLQIMDTHIIENNSRWQNMDLKQSKDATKLILDKAFDKNLNYFSVLFHDIYFSENFKTWKEWYMWLVGYSKDNSLEFINYRDAIKELEGSNN